jgi:hypothetical protein
MSNPSFPAIVIEKLRPLQAESSLVGGRGVVQATMNHDFLDDGVVHTPNSFSTTNTSFHAMVNARVIASPPTLAPITPLPPYEIMVMTTSWPLRYLRMK